MITENINSILFEKQEIIINNKQSPVNHFMKNICEEQIVADVGNIS